jgi:tRNA pseudouridine13 synthase
MIDHPPLENQVGIEGYISRSPGFGGDIKKYPEDFLVQEIIPDGQILKTGKELGTDVGGMYIHFTLWKRGIDTNSAIKKICRLCNHSEKDFGYAGLKDAQAETLQRVSVWSGQKTCLEKINFPNMKILNPIKQKFGISIGDLLGNYFQVKIRNLQRNVSQTELEILCSDIKTQGFLNFYGLQRFGSKRPILHKIGLHLLREEYSLAIDTYLGEVSKFEHETISKLRQMYIEEESLTEIFSKYPSSYFFEKRMLSGLLKQYSEQKIILSLPIYFLRLSISAYQSFLFNQLLSTLHSRKFKLYSELDLPLIGFSTHLTELSEEIESLLQDFLSKDEISPKSFNHRIKKLSSKGTMRPAIIKPSNIKIYLESPQNRNLKVTFGLPKGSYGTMLLRELIKSNSVTEDYSG